MLTNTLFWVHLWDRREPGTRIFFTQLIIDKHVFVETLSPLPSLFSVAFLSVYVLCSVYLSEILFLVYKLEKKMLAYLLWRGCFYKYFRHLFISTRVIFQTVTSSVGMRFFILCIFQNDWYMGYIVHVKWYKQSKNKPIQIK